MTIENETAMINIRRVSGNVHPKPRTRTNGKALVKTSTLTTRLCTYRFWHLVLSIWLAPTSRELLLYLSQDWIPSQEWRNQFWGCLWMLSETKIYAYKTDVDNHNFLASSPPSCLFGLFWRASFYILTSTSERDSFYIAAWSSFVLKRILLGPFYSDGKKTFFVSCNWDKVNFAEAMRPVLDYQSHSLPLDLDTLFYIYIPR